MSKPVKAMLRKELIARLAGVESLTVLSLAGVNGVENTRLRRHLQAKDIRVMVVRNVIARQALEEVGLGSACRLIDGPCALVTGALNPVVVVRELLEQAKDIPSLLVRGALMEGEVFGPERVEELSRYPTREEALANLVGQALSPGGQVVAALLGAGARLAAIVKAVEDRAGEAENN